jgi:Tol biopolymer transport system component
MRTFFIAIVVARLLSTAGAQAPKAYDDMWPAWSPDGRFIVFSSTRDGDPEIYVMTSTGTSPRRLTTSPGRDAHPSWSPDGTKIVFQSPRQDGHTRIFVMDGDGSNQRALTRNEGFCGVPTWSPDGRLIAFQCTRDLERTSTDSPWKLFVMTADGGPPRQLTHGPANDQVPNWSSDGRRLIFYSDRSGVDQLYTMDAAGGPASALTKTVAANRGASWSPDGSSIVFQSEREGSPSDIYLMQSGSDEALRLTSSGPEHGVPFFSPDGRTIVYQGRSGGSWRIWLMDPDGRNQRELGADVARIEDMAGMSGRIADQ